MVVVVRGGRTAILHRPPALAAALHGPDVLSPDHLADAQVGGVRPHPLRDRVALGRAVDHDVEGLAAAVLPAVGAHAPVGAHLREGRAHRAVHQNRVGGEPALDVGPGRAGCVGDRAAAARGGRRLGRLRHRGRVLLCEVVRVHPAGQAVVGDLGPAVPDASGHRDPGSHRQHVEQRVVLTGAAPDVERRGHEQPVLDVGAVHRLRFRRRGRGRRRRAARLGLLGEPHPRRGPRDDLHPAPRQRLGRGLVRRGGGGGSRDGGHRAGGTGGMVRPGQGGAHHRAGHQAGRERRYGDPAGQPQSAGTSEGLSDGSGEGSGAQPGVLEGTGRSRGGRAWCGVLLVAGWCHGRSPTQGGRRRKQ